MNGRDEAAEHPLDTQDLLFDGDFSPMPEDLGFRGPVACGAAEITYRQLDYWARTGLVAPEIRAAGGSGAGNVCTDARRVGRPRRDGASAPSPLTVAARAEWAEGAA